MSENKKYFYLKIKDTFFDTPELKVLAGMKNGAEYQNLYLKLCLLSAKNHGRLEFRDGIPYDIEMLSSVLSANIDTVKTGIEILIKIKLIDMLDTGIMFMTDIQKLIGHSSTEAERLVEYRRKIKAEKKKTIVYECTKMKQKCTPELELDSELNSDKDLNTKQTKKSKELSVTIVPGLTEIKKVYSDRIYAHGITVLNETIDYIQFTNTFKKLIKTHTQEQITEYVTRWIDEGIGAWCGYKLRNFAGDIGKLTNTVKKQSHAYQTAAEKQSEIIARIMREGEENDRNSMQNNSDCALYQQKQIIQ